MIQYEQIPVTILDDALIKQWTVRPEALLFFACVKARMHQAYLDAINVQCKAVTEEDRKKFNNQAQPFLDEAKDIQTFLRVFEKLADSKTNLYTIRTHT